MSARIPMLKSAIAHGDHEKAEKEGKKIDFILRRAPVNAKYDEKNRIFQEVFGLDIRSDIVITVGEAVNNYFFINQDQTFENCNRAAVFAKSIKLSYRINQDPEFWDYITKVVGLTKDYLSDDGLYILNMRIESVKSRWEYFRLKISENPEIRIKAINKTANSILSKNMMPNTQKPISRAAILSSTESFLIPYLKSFGFDADLEEFKKFRESFFKNGKTVAEPEAVKAKGYADEDYDYYKNRILDAIGKDRKRLAKTELEAFYSALGRSRYIVVSVNVIDRMKADLALELYGISDLNEAATLRTIVGNYFFMKELGITDRKGFAEQHRSFLTKSPEYMEPIIRYVKGETGVKLEEILDRAFYTNRSLDTIYQRWEYLKSLVANGHEDAEGPFGKLSKDNHLDYIAWMAAHGSDSRYIKKLEDMGLEASMEGFKEFVGHLPAHPIK